jgi:hypothetical protein
MVRLSCRGDSTLTRPDRETLLIAGLLLAAIAFGWQTMNAYWEHQNAVRLLGYFSHSVDALERCANARREENI